MLSLLYVFAFMAICINASPMHLAPRAFGPFGPSLGGTAVSSTAQQQQSAGGSSSVNVGPLGYSSSNSFHEQSSSSSSTSAVSNSFLGIGGQIAALQSMLQSQSFSQQMALQSFSQLAGSFGSALGQVAGCSACLGSGPFQSTAYSTFSQFAELLALMQSRFGPAQFNQFLAPFSPYFNSFSTFFQSMRSSSTSWNTIVPPQLPGLLGAIPGFTGLPGLPAI